MVAAPVSPLERQQLESLRAARATYWHRTRFELVGRRGRAPRRHARCSTSAPAPACSATGWPTERPELRYRFEETVAGAARPLVARFGAAAEVDPHAPIPAGTLVVMLDVLEHIEDDAAALAGAARPDGARRRRSSSPCRRCSGRSRRGTPSSATTAATPAAGCATTSTAAGFDVRLGRATCSPSCSRCCVARRLRRAPREQVDFPELSPAGRRRRPRGRARRRRRPAGCGRSARPWWPSPPADRDRGDALATPAARLWVVCPMLRDTESYLRLHDEVIDACRGDGWTGELRFVVVDDSAGTDHEVAQLAAHPDVTVLTPPFGLGHQRAIVYGLRYITPDVGADDVVVTMDSDGEDQPADLPRLVDELRDERRRARPRPAHEAVRAARVPGHVRLLPARVPRAHRAHDPLRQLRRPARRRRSSRPSTTRASTSATRRRCSPCAARRRRCRAPAGRASPARRA